MKAFREFVTLTADGVHQHNIKLKRLEESHTYFLVTYLKDITNDFSLDYLRMKTLFFVNHTDKSDLKKC